MGDSYSGDKYCNNCKRYIASANYTMHSIHCHRNLTLCELCKEPVRADDMEEHIKEDHALISCPDCRTNLQKFQLDEHTDKTCSKRMVRCEFCEIEKCFDEMSEHESYCGSRTEVCEMCGQRMMIKNRSYHAQEAHGQIDTSNAVSESSKISSIPKLQESQNSFNSATVLPSVNNANITKVNVLNANKRTNDMPQVNTSVPDKNSKPVTKMPSASDLISNKENSAIPVECLSDEVIARNLEKELNNDRSVDFHDPDAVPIVYSNVLNTGDKVSQLLNLITDSESDAIRNEYLAPDELYDPVTEPSNIDPVNIFPSCTDVQEQEAILKSVLSSKYDNERNNTVNKNQSDYYLCEFCERLVDSSTFNQHEEQCRRRRSTEADCVDGRASPSSPPASNKGNDSIPCQFCSYVYPFAEIEVHQNNCNRNAGTNRERTDNGAEGVNSSQPEQPPSHSSANGNLQKNRSNESCKENLAKNERTIKTFSHSSELPAKRFERNVVSSRPEDASPRVPNHQSSQNELQQRSKISPTLERDLNMLVESSLSSLSNQALNDYLCNVFSIAKDDSSSGEDLSEKTSSANEKVPNESKDKNKSGRKKGRQTKKNPSVSEKTTAAVDKINEKNAVNFQKNDHNGRSKEDFPAPKKRNNKNNPHHSNFRKYQPQENEQMNARNLFQQEMKSSFQSPSYGQFTNNNLGARPRPCYDKRSNLEVNGDSNVDRKSNASYDRTNTQSRRGRGAFTGARPRVRPDKNKNNHSNENRGIAEVDGDVDRMPNLSNNRRIPQRNHIQGFSTGAVPKSTGTRNKNRQQIGRVNIED